MIKIGFIGDLILSPKARYDESLLKKLKATDMNIANLESPFVQDSFKPYSSKGGLFQLTNNCDQLRELNIKAVSLANNHMFDFGEEGISETIRTLEKGNIIYFGAGENLQQATELKQVTIGGKTIAFGGFVTSYLKPHFATANRSGTAPLSERSIIDQLKNNNSDFKILFNHWNQEFEDYPDPLFLDMSRRLIKHCNCIIGAHSHCIQGVTEENGKAIFHSIGNFTMPHSEYRLKSLGKFPDHCYESFFVILHIDNENNASYEKVPYKILDEGNHIAEMSPEEAEIIDNKCIEISRPLSLSYKEYLKFYRKVKRRKFRPVLRKSHIRNNINIWFAFLILGLIRGITNFFAGVFDFLGIRHFIRRRFAFILNRIFRL